LDFDFSHATNTPFNGWQNAQITKYARLSQVNADSRRNPRQRSTK
jgi:hypothetical protein